MRLLGRQVWARSPANAPATCWMSTLATNHLCTIRSRTIDAHECAQTAGMNTLGKGFLELKGQRDTLTVLSSLERTDIVISLLPLWPRQRTQASLTVQGLLHGYP